MSKSGVSLSRFGVLLVVALVGCASEQSESRAPEQGAALASFESEIINGTVDTGHPAVGEVDSGNCTATLIGRRTVLTAAHCVNGLYGIFCSNGYCATGFYTKHPSFISGQPHYDVAVLKLNQDFQTLSGILPTRIANTSTSTSTSVNIVGFGCNAKNPYSGSGTRRQGWNVIHDVDSHTIQWDNSSARLCPGDSGGPTYVGADCQIGVHSGVQNFFGGYDDVAARVDTTEAWMRGVAVDSSILNCNQTVCGDGTCHPGEKFLGCPSDCPPVCGNQACETGEPSVCPADCPLCGDGICAFSEHGLCAEDCGTCGNGICEPGDTTSCGGDCGLSCDFPPCN